MNKNVFIERWGEEAYEKRMKTSRDWRQAHPENTEKWHKQIRDWQQANPTRVKRLARDNYRKHRQEILDSQSSGNEGLRNSIRAKYGKLWRKYKRFVASETRLHYKWVSTTANYKCIALVEKDQSQYLFEDVILFPTLSRWRVVRYLIAKHLLYKQLMPAFTDEELQAGVEEA
jgi:exonuclease VII large subunit